MRPMLAATVKDLSILKYPVYCTPKLDGIRCLVINGVAYTRNMKLIPNHHIRASLALLNIDTDGELVIDNDFQKTQSGVMTQKGIPAFIYKIFDYLSFKKSDKYIWRVRVLADQSLPHFCKILMPIEVTDSQQLLHYENNCLNYGFEGIIIRNDSCYKQGRSTLKEQGMLKLKRFTDSEAVVLGFLPRMHNANPKKTNELGYSQRSTHKGNMVKLETLGALQVRDLKTGIEFEIGSGFNDKQRKQFWKYSFQLVGKHVKYKYQSIGIKEKPRFPVFLGFRSPLDI